MVIPQNCIYQIRAKDDDAKIDKIYENGGDGILIKEALFLVFK